MGPVTRVAAASASKRGLVRRLFAWRRPGESDRRLGVRLAVSAPLFGYVALFVGLLAWRVDGETGLGLSLAYCLFIGLAQLIYLIPCIVVAAWRRRPNMAKGFAIGGGIIAGADLVAWGLGVYVIGPR